MIDQNSQFFAILTNVGAAKLANANALGIPWNLTHLGVGDANNTDPIPNATQTKLINEWRRAPLNQLRVDPANAAVVIAEQVIPADVGGKWIREIGLYDADNDLVAVANCAPTYKPLQSQGSGRTQVIRMNLIVSSTGNITLKIDPAVVLATRWYVDNAIEVSAQKHPYDGTPGKFARVGAFGWGSSYSTGPMLLTDMVGDQTTYSGLYRYSPETIGHPGFGSGYGSVLQGSISAAGGNWATQLVIDYADDAIGFRRLSGPAGWMPFLEIWHKGNLKPATQEQANSGLDDKTFITPKKFSAALAALIIQATETIRGIASVATTKDLDDGTDDTRFVTAKKLTAWLRKKVVPASYTEEGIVRFADATEVSAGNSAGKAVNPAVLKYGFVLIKGATSGCIIFPLWLGRFTLQWTKTAALTSTAGTVWTYPVGFTDSVVGFFGMFNGTSAGTLEVIDSSTTEATFANGLSGSTSLPAYVFAAGFMS